MLCLIIPFKKMVFAIAGTETNALLVLPTFHSAFNIANTFIMIWFVPLIEKTVCKIIKPKPQAEDEDSRLIHVHFR